MPKLILTTASGETTQVALHANENTLGRDAQNDIVVDSAQASRQHAVIVVEPAFVTIRDLGSRNGTFVNEDRITSQLLADGDVIRLGTYEIRFKAADQEYSRIEARRLPTEPGLLVDLDRENLPTTPAAPTAGRGKP